MQDAMEILRGMKATEKRSSGERWRDGKWNEKITLPISVQVRGEHCRRAS